MHGERVYTWHNFKKREIEVKYSTNEALTSIEEVCEELNAYETEFVRSLEI